MTRACTPLLRQHMGGGRAKCGVPWNVKCGRAIRGLPRGIVCLDVSRAATDGDLAGWLPRGYALCALGGVSTHWLNGRTLTATLTLSPSPDMADQELCRAGALALFALDDCRAQPVLCRSLWNPASAMPFRRVCVKRPLFSCRRVSGEMRIWLSEGLRSHSAKFPVARRPVRREDSSPLLAGSQDVRLNSPSHVRLGGEVKSWIMHAMRRDVDLARVLQEGALRLTAADIKPDPVQ